MNESMDESARFPLLEQLSKQRGLQILPVYRIRDAALLFGVKPRTMNDWVADGRITVRELPGHGRFLAQDLENLLATSARNRKLHDPEPQSEKARRRRGSV